MNAQDIAQALCDYYGSEKEVAAKTGFSQSTINRIRRGINQPNWATYQRLVKQFSRINKAA